MIKRNATAAIAAVLLLSAAATAAEPPPPPTLPTDGYRIVSQDEVGELIYVPVRPYPCPLCSFMASVPEPWLLSGEGVAIAGGRWGLQSSDWDSDTCPHPAGARIKFQADITVCPKCGFAAYTEDFMQPQPPEVKRWVDETVTPSFRIILRRLMGEPTEPAAPSGKNVRPVAGKGTPERLTDEQLANFFVKPESIPDIVRCELARVYYETHGKDPLQTAKITWTTAWAYRRSMSGPLDGRHLGTITQKIIQSLNRRTGFLPDFSLDPNEPVKKWIHTLHEMQERNRSSFERLALSLLMAGGYARLGYGEWAMASLQNVVDGATHQSSTFASAVRIDATPEERNAEIRNRQALLIYHAEVGLQQIATERQLLHLASERLLAIARGGDHDVQRLYLIGEFARRAGNYPRAALWLYVADSIAKGSSGAPGIEIFAASQLDVLNYYMEDRGETIPAPPAEELAFAERVLAAYGLDR